MGRPGWTGGASHHHPAIFYEAKLHNERGGYCGASGAGGESHHRPTIPYHAFDIASEAGGLGRMGWATVARRFAIPDDITSRAGGAGEMGGEGGTGRASGGSEKIGIKCYKLL